MRITRLVAGAVAAGLLGVTPIALTAPAHADGQTYTPIVTAELNPMGSPYEAPFYYGQEFYVSGSVTDPNGGYDATGGIAYLQVLTADNPVWTTIAEDTSPNYLFFDADFAFSENAQFKVVFTGAPATSPIFDTLLPAESAAMDAATTRKVTFKNPRDTVATGKISPDYKKKPIKVQKKVGKKWVKFRTFKTSKRSTYRFSLPAPRRGKWFWRITVPGGSDFTDWVAVVNTYSFRAATNARVASLR